MREMAREDGWVVRAAGGRVRLPARLVSQQHVGGGSEGTPSHATRGNVDLKTLNYMMCSKLRTYEVC
jgi:hypothetical protein